MLDFFLDFANIGYEWERELHLLSLLALMSAGPDPTIQNEPLSYVLAVVTTRMYIVEVLRRLRKTKEAPAS